MLLSLCAEALSLLSAVLLACGKKPAPTAETTDKHDAAPGRQATPPAVSCAEEAPRPSGLPYREETWISTFDGAKLRSALRVEPKQLGTMLRHEIAGAQDQLVVVKNELDTARDETDAACERFIDTLRNFRDAVARANAQNADAYAELVTASDGIGSIIDCWSYASDANRQLSLIQNRVQAVSLFLVNKPAAQEDVTRSSQAMLKAFADFSQKRTDIRAKADVYRATAKEIAGLMYKAAQKSAINNANALALEETVTALPKLEVISQQLELIIDHVKATSEHLVVDRKNAVCRTSSAIATSGWLDEKSVDELVKVRDLWNARKSAVQDAVSRAYEFDGAD